MCGLTGFFAPSRSPTQDMQEIALRMIRKLTHRGPDDEGVWCDVNTGIALAHRRLSILDLSVAGHQPMPSTCNRYVLVFNGEIYNHLELRRDLEARNWHFKTKGWQGHSDTETLLAAITAWGLERALHRSVGMFAFALFDRQKKALFLARDRLGEKPLYYGLHRHVFLFGSELKALREYPQFYGEVDRDALALFLRFNFVPAPFSIYRGIFKLPAGTWLRVTQDDIVTGRLPKAVPYWSLSMVAANGQTNRFRGNTVEATIELERLLKQSVVSQMLADVPLGAFLSGGIDSSTVVALMQDQSMSPVKTFTIGFSQREYDESEHARAVASYLGTEHAELLVTPEQVLAIIQRIPMVYDEPFADVSQIPTMLVSQLARRDVTVCLSGDGADELFGGYNRYVSGPYLWRRLGWLPLTVRESFATAITTFSPSTWDACFSHFKSVLPTGWKHRTPGDKLHKLAKLLLVTEPAEIYTQLTSQWSNPEQVVIGHMLSKLANTDSDHAAVMLPELENQMMCTDTTTYLPDDILVKIDRAAMGVSLETRVPMLDHRLVEFAWTLPLKMKIRGNEGKWLLRKVLDRYVPSSLVERPKAGFSVPIDTWLRGPLRAWAEDLLDQKKLKNDGFFAPTVIETKWKEHLDGKCNWSNQIWGVLMFQAWLHEHT